MSSPPTLPVEVLRAPMGGRVLNLRGLLTVRLTPEQCEDLCRQLCEDEKPERALA